MGMHRALSHDQFRDLFASDLVLGVEAGGLNANIRANTQDSTEFLAAREEAALHPRVDETSDAQLDWMLSPPSEEPFPEDDGRRAEATEHNARRIGKLN